jgi:hypothetical protein
MTLTDPNEEREKTQRQPFQFFQKTQEIIIEKYSTDSNRIFPSISNQNSIYLKEISVITGIEKRLTHHIARKLCFNGIV